MIYDFVEHFCIQVRAMLCVPCVHGRPARFLRPSQPLSSEPPGPGGCWRRAAGLRPQSAVLGNRTEHQICPKWGKLDFGG
jgi:hypothetical protein